MKGIELAAIVAYYICAGWLIRLYGLVPTQTAPDSINTPSNPGLFDLVSWVWDNLVTYFQLATMQVEVSYYFVNLCFLLVGIILFWEGVRIIRGVS